MFTFKGSYGSGKSLVAQDILERFLKKNISGVFYVITWDIYSLLFAELFELCNVLRHQGDTNVQLICKSLLDISEEKGSSKPLTLPECLSYLSSIQDGDINILIEELDPELITKIDSEAINSIINASESYKNSLITIVLQSINKERVTITNEGSFSHNVNTVDELTSMKVYNLKTTMRYTKEINKAINIAQACVSSANNIYLQQGQEDIRSKNEELMNSSKQRGPTQYNQSPDAVEDSIKSDVKSAPRDQLLVEKKSVFEVHPNIDSIAKIINADHSHGANGTRLETSYSFPNNVGCGHNISNEKPCLIRMKPEFKNKNIDSINTLASIFDECLPRWNRRSLLIINDLKLAELILSAFNVIDIDVLEYLFKLKNEIPSSEVKRNVYKEWKNNNDCILVTDNRGACGLQHDKVEIPLLLILIQIKRLHLQMCARNLY